MIGTEKERQEAGEELAKIREYLIRERHPEWRETWKKRIKYLQEEIAQYDGQSPLAISDLDGAMIGEYHLELEQVWRTDSYGDDITYYKAYLAINHGENPARIRFDTYFETQDKNRASQLNLLTLEHIIDTMVEFRLLWSIGWK